METNEDKKAEPVTKAELNKWKRGFTPQAEIWNGRMAIIGLIFISSALLISNYLISK